MAHAEPGLGHADLRRWMYAHGRIIARTRAFTRGLRLHGVLTCLCVRHVYRYPLVACS